jgi:hypothetical protein
MMDSVWMEVQLEKEIIDEDELKEHVELFIGVKSVEVLDEEDYKRNVNATLESVGEKLWRIMDRNNPGVIGDCLTEICEDLGKDFSNIVVIPETKSLKDIPDVPDVPDIGVWTKPSTDDYELSESFGRMKGVQRAEVLSD